MRRTAVAALCQYCGREFELFSDDDAGDKTVIWNWCPECGTKNNYWIKFLDGREMIKVPLALTEQQARALRARSRSGVRL